MEVKTVWDDGSTSEKPAPSPQNKGRRPAETRFTLADLLPSAYALNDLNPIDPAPYSFNRPLTFAGKKYETGEPSATTQVEFIIFVDGKEMWRSGLLSKSDPAKTIDIDISGVKILSLKVVGPETRGYGRGGVIAGWADALVLK